MTITTNLPALELARITDASALTPTPTATEARCPTCTTPMERHGAAWVCPKQRDEEQRQAAIARADPITEATKARGRALLRQRVDGCDF